MQEILSGNHGIPSICSAHSTVLREALRFGKTRSVLIETTCNQVNQFGGYTGMTPDAFVSFSKKIAEEIDCPHESIILGGDHLGPYVWKNEPSDSAMQKSREMIQAYVSAGYTKLHLDCSMHLGDDPIGILDPFVIAKRAAWLAKAAEEMRDELGTQEIHYVIGTEVPVPGGSLDQEFGIHVTEVPDVQKTIENHKEAFYEIGLYQAWNRVIAVVVQPGVEFGDDFVINYDPNEAVELSNFIEDKNMVYEAHSTDYQPKSALSNLVRDHFAILKVGPALTYAYREAIFSLAMMENELFHIENKSNIITMMDDVMIEYPKYWANYYNGTQEEQAFKRKYSLSDRIRYYWNQPKAQLAASKLMENLSNINLPLSLVSQYSPEEMKFLDKADKPFTPDNIIASRISKVLDTYWSACE